MIWYVVTILAGFVLQLIAHDLQDRYFAKKRERQVREAQEQLKRFFELEDQLMRQKYSWWDDVMGDDRNGRSSD